MVFLRLDFFPSVDLSLAVSFPHEKQRIWLCTLVASSLIVGSSLSLPNRSFFAPCFLDVFLLREAVDSSPRESEDLAFHELAFDCSCEQMNFWFPSRVFCETEEWPSLFISYRIVKLMDSLLFISYRIVKLLDSRLFISYRIVKLSDPQLFISYRIVKLLDLPVFGSSADFGASAMCSWFVSIIRILSNRCCQSVVGFPSSAGSVPLL